MATSTAIVWPLVQKMEEASVMTMEQDYTFTSEMTSAMTSTITTVGSATTSTATEIPNMEMSMSYSGREKMSMNEYFVADFEDKSVLFKTFRATTAGGAFGIFCFIFLLAFFLRGLLFLNSYLELIVFHSYSSSLVVKEIGVTTVSGCCAAIDDPNSDASTEKTKNAPFYGFNATVVETRSFWSKFFCPGIKEAVKDVVRFLFAFIGAMMSYALMLAVMSFVILYFFAACLGIAFGEIFFNRLSIIYGISSSNRCNLCASLR